VVRNGGADRAGGDSRVAGGAAFVGGGRRTGLNQARLPHLDINRTEHKESHMCAATTPQAGPILVTGAAGNQGGIGRTLTKLLLDEGFRVRAMVRRQDERADRLTALGAEVIVGDLLDLKSMHAAIEGCERVYFGMSVSASYLEATVNAAAVARHHGIKAFVNISQMTVSQMSITETTPSPQHKLHWLAEQALNWSGLPVVHVRPTVFMEGFFRQLCAPLLQRSDVLSLPMGQGKTSPICADDVARAVAVILKDPAPHLGRIYNLAGPRSETMAFHASLFSEALGRSITYEDIAIEPWRERLVKWRMPQHLIDHLTAMAELTRQNRYDRTSDDMVKLTGAPAMSLLEFVRRNASAYTLSA
jgi:uncharacterized protein YbjT (DUF2867 family)